MDNKISDKKDVCSIVFTGDIAFSKVFADGWKNEGCLDKTVSDFLKSADHVIANVESPLTSGDFSAKKDLLHASDPEAGKFLWNNHMRIWSLANNHISDCGEQGVMDTLQCAGNNKCHVIGAGRNLEEASQTLILGNEVKIGILSFAGLRENIRAGEDHPGALTWDREDLIQKRISELRKGADWVVLVIHGMDEFYNMPSPNQRERYHKYLDYGADIIIGHHPHVVQNYEKVGKKVIFYSIGNFIFGTDYQKQFMHTDCGMLIRLDFSKESFDWTPFPVKIDFEKAAVQHGDIPDIFCNIDEKNYKLIWSLESRRIPLLTQVKKIVRKKIYPDRGIKGWIKNTYRWFRKFLHTTERKNELVRLSSYLNRWKHSPLKEVVTYICTDEKYLKDRLKTELELYDQKRGKK